MTKVTIKDVAYECGVSTATVSRVLNNKGYASPEVKEKVREVAKRLNYQPNAIARSLKMDRTYTIGIIIPDIANMYFMKISRGIEDIIEHYQYNLIFASCDENPMKERRLLEVLLEKRVDAIVLATSGGNDDLINSIQMSGTPIILLDRKLQNNPNDIDLVVEDNIKGAYDITSHILNKGHKRIGVINGSLKVSTGYERFEGFKMAMEEYKMDLDPELIYNGNFIQEDGINAVNQFLELDDKPTAIISFNNTMAFGAILQLRKRGFRIPDDIVIASYGETEEAQLLKSPGIMFIKQSPYEIGMRAGQIIIDRLVHNLDEPVQEIFSPVMDIIN